MNQTERERILLLETNHQQMMDNLEELKTKQKENHAEIKDIIITLREEVKDAMAKKSDIWVEKAVTWLLYTVAGIIVGALMYLVVKQ